MSDVDTTTDPLDDVRFVVLDPSEDRKLVDYGLSLWRRGLSGSILNGADIGGLTSDEAADLLFLTMKYVGKGGTLIVCHIERMLGKQPLKRANRLRRTAEELGIRILATTSLGGSRAPVWVEALRQSGTVQEMFGSDAG